jgi:chromate transporter
MVKYCELFTTFFKVGTFTIGGGYAMIPLIQREVVDRHKWLSEEEMLDVIALSQTMPGIMAANIAAVVGQKLRGIKGALLAVLGNILMPIIFILLIAIFFRQFKDVPTVQHIFMGIRPAVVALIAAPVFLLWKGVWRSAGRCKGVQIVPYVIIPVISCLLIWLLGVSPVLVILAAILLGGLFGLTAGRDSLKARNHRKSK